jgi:homocysteine S-methyltransferase
MPNAAYPTVRGSRTFYDGNPAYFAQILARLPATGAKLLGGCCGTTPDYIAAAAKALSGSPAVKVTYPAKKPEAPAPEKAPVSNPFWEALCDENRKPFAVELDSPANADVTKFMAGARELQASGASVITIADCPIARARMDSSLMACKLKRELGMDAIPHMTCRDRNLNATQALLLGLSAEEIRNVLVITGDPIPSAQRDEVKSVYNFNSRKLIAYVKSLNETVLPEPFQIFGALNLNVRNFHMQLALAQEKEEKGACGFLTQPVLSAQALENLKLARQTLKGKILGGIMPVVSQRNAIFMENEISGINVCQEIIDLYEGADREQGETLAVRVSAAIAREIDPYVDGYYLMTPFGRTGLMAKIMDAIRGNS